MPKRTLKRDLQRSAAYLPYLFAITGILLSWGMAPHPTTQHRETTDSLPEKKNSAVPSACQHIELQDNATLALCKVIQVSGVAFDHEIRQCYRAIQQLNATDSVSVHVATKTHHDVHLHNAKKLHYHSIEKEAVARAHFYERNLQYYEKLLEIHQRYLNRTNNSDFLSTLKKSDDVVSRFLCREFEKTGNFEKIFTEHFKQYEQLNRKQTSTDTCAAHEEVRRVLADKKDTAICQLEKAIKYQEEKVQKLNHRSIFHTGSTLFQSSNKCTGNRREPASVCRLHYRK